MKRRKRPTRYQQERERFRNTQRKILNLEERVQAIQLYDVSPIYMRVATAMNCSWEQIKNVIQNRDAILGYYARCQTVGANDNPRVVRQKKINFLGKVMYEYIRRAHYYRSVVIDDETVRDRALRFRNVLQIDCFTPNKAWVADFKASYNLDFTQLDALVYAQKPASSLHYVDIVVYCSKELEDIHNNGVGAAIAPSESVSDVNNILSVNSLIDVNDVIDVDSRDSQDYDIYNIDDTDQQDGFDDNECIDFGEEETDADSVADSDADDINENEEGPTIYYGDVDYNDDAEEMLQTSVESSKSTRETRSAHKETQQLVSQVKQLSPKVNLVTATQSLGLAQTLPAESDLEIEQQKSSKHAKTTPKDQEQLPLVPFECVSKIECETAATVTTDTSTKATTTTTTIIDNTLMVSFRESLRKDNYAAAQEILLPLQEFALLEENFSAINLLAQLMATFRKGSKHKMQGSKP